MIINTPAGEIPDRRVISYDDYLRLLGLLTLAADHRQALKDIAQSACALLDDNDPLGHTADAVWGGQKADAQVLLKLLGITVAPKE